MTFGFGCKESWTLLGPQHGKLGLFWALLDPLDPFGPTSFFKGILSRFL